MSAFSKHYSSAGRAEREKNSHQSDHGASELEGPLLAVGATRAPAWGGTGMSRVWGCLGHRYPTEPGHQDQLWASLLRGTG